MPIKAILESLYSKRDRNGNCYWAFKYTDVATGKQVVGTISGGESNIYAILRVMGIEHGDYHYTVTAVPIREFNKLTKNWAYAGCPPDDIARYVREMLEH